MVGMRLGVDSRYGMKIEMALDFWKFPTEAGKKLSRIKIWPNEYYQNVDLGLKFHVKALKLKNIGSGT